MSQPDIFTETYMSLEEQCLAIANPVCHGCEFAISSAQRAAKLLVDAGFTNSDSASLELDKLTRENPEARRLLSNLLATLSCRGEIGSGKCSMDISK